MGFSFASTWTYTGYPEIFLPIGPRPDPLTGQLYEMPTHPCANLWIADYSAN
jgi:hypothetical protein